MDCSSARDILRSIWGPVPQQVTCPVRPQAGLDLRIELKRSFPDLRWRSGFRTTTIIIFCYYGTFIMNCRFHLGGMSAGHDENQGGLARLGNQVSRQCEEGVSKSPFNHAHWKVWSRDMQVAGGSSWVCKMSLTIEGSLS